MGTRYPPAKKDRKNGRRVLSQQRRRPVFEKPVNKQPGDLPPPKKAKSGVKLTKAEQKTLAAGRELQLNVYRSEEAKNREVTVFDGRRRRIANTYRSKLLKAALANAGIDTAAIARRQQLDQQTVQRFIRAREAQAQARSRGSRDKGRLFLKRSAAQMAQFLRLNGSERLLPTVYAVLNTATEIECIGPVLNGQVRMDLGKSSLGAGRNIAKAGLITARLMADAESRSQRVNWHFIWTPPRDGLLNAVACMALDGYVWREADPQCSSVGRAGTSIGLSFSIFQAGLPAADETDTITNPFYQGQTDGTPYTSSTEWADYSVHDFVTLIHDHLLPVAAGVPVLLTVSADLVAWADWGVAGINFGADDFQLNVPYLYVALA